MFLDKLNKFNQNISYIIFALNGYLAVLVNIYLFYIMPSGSASGMIGFIYNLIIIAIYFFAGIVWGIEQITEYKLPFNFLKHTLCTVFLLIGAIISTLYLSNIIITFLYLEIMT